MTLSVHTRRHLQRGLLHLKKSLEAAEADVGVAQADLKTAIESRDHLRDAIKDMSADLDAGGGLVPMERETYG